MDRFVSSFTCRFDAKGRISLPAPYRAILTRQSFEGLFVTPSLDHPALDCGGAALLAEIEALLASLPLWSAQRDAYASALLGAGEWLRLDAEGRMSLSEKFKSRLSLLQDAIFVGQGHKFQIWAPERFGAHLSAAQAQLRQLRSGAQ